MARAVRVSEAAAPAGERPGRFRYVVVSSLFLVVTVMFLDRAALSILIVDPQFLADFGIADNPAAQGLLMSVFLFVYAGANMVLGPLGDRLGARKLMAISVGVWAAASALMGAASTYSLLLVGRALRGIGEGPTFPMMARYIRNWFPPAERGRANTIWLLGHHVGPALALPLALALVSTFGWRSVLYFQAVVCLGLAAPVLVALTADRAGQSAWVGPAEARHIEGSGPVQASESLGWLEAVRLFAGKTDYWLAVLYHLAQLSLLSGLITWLPKYLADERGFNLRAAAYWGALPYVVGAIAMIAFAFVSHRIHRQALFQAAVKLITAICVAAAAYTPWNEASAVLFAVALGAWSLSPPLYYAMIQRIAPSRAMGAASGLDNGLANIGAAFAPTVIGVLIATTGTYFAGLLFLASASALAAAVMVVMSWRGF
ncbi:MAG: MFS transporter [Chloroflexi bacterium]|nr:MFS transporter [Chloroflexota bacterium]